MPANSRADLSAGSLPVDDSAAPAVQWIPSVEEVAATIPDGERWFASHGLRLPPPVLIFPIPEDRGAATLSVLGHVEYVEDLIRPGRIVGVAAEEGVGKSYAISGELGIRLAVAGGSFAGTWPILQTGPVLILSEMHPDDDYQREDAILDALDLTRDALTGCYFRLTLASAAGDRPALQVPEWREYIAAWLREQGALMLVIDTATAAAQVDPWGSDIQGIYRGLRGMIESYPALCIALVVHLKKPQGRGERRISDVLGEWGRWCDVLLLLEADGLERVKLTSRKRVRHERRIVATKAGGLLVDAQELEGSGPKVPPADVLNAIRAEPGLSIRRLAARLGVSRATARKYADEVPGIVLRPGLRGAMTCHLSDGVSARTDMSVPGEGGGDVSPVTPSIERGVTDMSPHTLFEETEEELLSQARGVAR
jgi:hypothetical protein